MDSISVKDSATNEPVLCYIEGSTAYFTTQKLSEQRGDGWGKIPYEHNSHRPYKPCWHSEPEHRKDGQICRCSICKNDWNNDGTPKWKIVEVIWEGPFQVPSELSNSDSRFSVEEINRRETPWLIQENSWLTRRDEMVFQIQMTIIMAGVTVSDFIRAIESVGGKAVLKE